MVAAAHRAGAVRARRAASPAGGRAARLVAPHPGGARAWESGYRGPPLVEAHARALGLARPRQRCREQERSLRDACSRWHRARDRELLSRVIPVTEVVGTGARLLTAAAREAHHDPESAGRVETRAWALASCCGRGEAARVRELADWCAEPMDLVTELDSRERERELAAAARAGRAAAEAGRSVERAVAEVVRADEAATELRGRLRRYHSPDGGRGGVTEIEEIGAAGEPGLAVTFAA